MASSAITTVFSILLFYLIWHISDCSLTLEANPKEINIGLTDSFSVKCSYLKNGSQSLSALVSLIVSRANNGSSEYEELASLNVFLGQLVNVITQENVKASGAINATGESFIELTWDLPTEDVAGNYKCTAQGPDNVGHNVVIDSTVDVKYSPPDDNALLNKIRQLNAHLKQVEDNLNLIKTEYAGRLAQLSENASSVLAICEQNAREIEALKQNGQSTSGDMKLWLDVVRTLLFFDKSESANATYWLSKNTFNNVQEAENLCKSYSGKLVEINSPEQYTVVRDFLSKNYTGVRFVYVGATDEQTEGSWVYRSDGRPVEFTAWSADQPKQGTDFNCMFLESSLDWKMSAYRCASLNPIHAVCEMA
ncbi:unnamed protein product [Lymnaea stagnalis]|uniref:C-type lectin domain-containing protein n=1 Tax=Lymnaea stagnalis TaxID=6523 RepID=A0AAV2I8H9_LYMST